MRILECQSEPGSHMSTETPERSTMTSGPRRRFGGATVLYMMAVIYVSLALQPEGFRFVPLHPGEAWHAYVTMPFVKHGVDQRSDWMGNLLMFVPLGFLATGALAWRRRRWQGGVLALGLCLVFLLAVKYAQLFFPPRTVTFNYVAAQAVGALIGTVLYLGSARRRHAWAASLLEV